MNKWLALCCSYLVLVNPIIGQDDTESLASDETGLAAPKWPRVIKVSNAEIIVYQPQLESFKGDDLTARAAVAVKRDKSDNTDYCAVWMKADLDTNKQTRIAKLKDIEILKIAYPDASEKVKKSLGDIIRKHLLEADMSISMDRLVAMLDTVEKQAKTDSKFDNTVPQFIFSNEPAVLVFIDGEPVMRDQGNGLSLVANSSFLIVQDTGNKKYYLKAAGRWFQAEKLAGPWQVSEKVPDNIAALDKKDDNGDKAKAGEEVPKIIVAMKPTVLIQSFGEPEVAKIPETNLSFLENSDSDVFRDDSTMKLYVLASGRWFTADKKEGPWTFIKSEQLPKDFKEIPNDSPKADVLASVAGTQVADDAIMESYIPQTATIKRGTVKLDIVYDGEPEFKPIEGTNMEYAVNTQTPVVKMAGKYYACDNAAWYVSASPKGDWDVCVEVPKDIYNIPPSCPIYNATFVKVYDYNDDDVDVGYTSGYYDSYPYGGVIVYGTGYWYRRWWRHHYWCPRPVPYVHPCRYNYHHGRWYRYDRYRDRYGKYVTWNRHNHPNAGKLPNYGYGQYRGKQPAEIRRNAYKYNKGVISTSQRVDRKSISQWQSGKKPQKLSNNVYVGRDGKIYKHGLDGWQQREKGKWHASKPSQKKTQPFKRPAEHTAKRPRLPEKRDASPRYSHHDLNRHYNSRQRGNYRSHQRSSYSRSSRSSYHQGGMSRGSRGGGRRR